MKYVSATAVYFARLLLCLIALPLGLALIFIAATAFGAIFASIAGLIAAIIGLIFVVGAIAGVMAGVTVAGVVKTVKAAAEKVT